jgi:hypothetical protein
MRTLIVFVICLFVFSSVSAQVSNAVSTTATQHNDGQWYLTISGDSVEIARICSYGDCGRGSASLIESLNYWYSILGASKGFTLVPIPPAPVSAVASEPIKPRDLFCSQLPHGLACPTRR